MTRNEGTSGRPEQDGCLAPACGCMQTDRACSCIVRHALTRVVRLTSLHTQAHTAQRQRIGKSQREASGATRRPWASRSRRKRASAPGPAPRGETIEVRRGRNEVSTSGTTANLSFFDRGTFWVLPSTYLYLPKSARAYLFPQSVKTHSFCSGPISVDPIRPQPRHAQVVLGTIM